MSDDKKNNQEEYNPLQVDYSMNLESSNRLSKSSIKNALKKLGLFDGCRVLDIPSGIGNHALLMLDENPNINIHCVDLSEPHLNFSKKKLSNNKPKANVTFESKDLNALDFEDDSFDFIWCFDGLWPGLKEFGCPCEEPYSILKEFSRITKKGGKVMTGYWSSQKLLPGYPLLEAALNDTMSANTPIQKDSSSQLHYTRSLQWFKKIGFKDAEAKTYVSDINAPLSEIEKDDLLAMIQMFWGRAEDEVSEDVWHQFSELTDRESKQFILNQPGYAGFLTYTVFIATVDK